MACLHYGMAHSLQWCCSPPSWLETQPGCPQCPLPWSPGLAEWSRLGRPGDKVVPSALVCGARGFLYLCLCIGMYVTSVFPDSPGAAEGAAAATPPDTFRPAGWAKVGPVSPKAPQPACHRRPQAGCRACPPLWNFDLPETQYWPALSTCQSWTQDTGSPRPQPN